ncbi:MAG: putative ABC transporter permease [Clostridia bacterium]|nr:putative ABC transporter permease [Clostridia bacterium]
MVIFGYDIRMYFLLFMTYAVLGWVMEVTCKLIEDKKFINRGFLIGPYCPIYGYGAILITILLKKYINDPFTLFIMAILICGVLEYLTSYFMEKIYKARWWDYSRKKFNINGRICLDTILPFGLLGLLIMYVLNPFFLEQIGRLSQIWLNILFWLLLGIFICDNIISEVVLRAVKTTEKGFGKELDNTEEITKKVRQILQEKSILHRRLLNAYPKIQAVKFKIKEQKEKIKKKGKEIQDNIEEKSNMIKGVIEQKNAEIKGKLKGENKVEKEK